MRKYLLFLLASALLMPSAAGAIMFSDTEVVELTEPVDDDVFFAGERITIDQTIAEDAYLAGSIIEVGSRIGQDLMAAGNSLTVSSPVGDDAFLAGDRIVLEGDTTVGDLFAAGRMLEIREGVEVSNDAYLAGARIILQGSFAGDVRVAGEAVEVGPTATIAGDLRVYGPNAPQISDGATINGSVQHITQTRDKKRNGLQSGIAQWVVATLTWFVASLLLLYLARRATTVVMENVYTKSLTSFALGLVWLIAVIPVTIAILLTVIGWPVALVVILLTLLFLLLSMAFLPLVVGTWLQRRFNSASTTTALQWQHALLGAAVVTTLQLIPIIGPLLTFVLCLIIFGTLLRLLKRTA